MTDLTACLIVGFHPDFDQHLEADQHRNQEG
jgi:hypothetical protein